jgi:hypothetical protein
MGYMRGGGNTPNNKIFWEGTTLTLAQNTLSYWGDLALAFTSKRVDLAAGMMREIINTGADVSAGFGMFNTNGDGLGGDTYDKINQDTDVVCTGQGRSGEATWA